MTACAWELQIQFQPCCLWPLINVKCGRSTSETPLLPAFFVFAPRTKAAVQCRCAGNYPLRHAGKTHFQSLVQGAAEDRPPRLILKTPVLAERKRESPAAAFTLYTSCGTCQQTTLHPPPLASLPEPKLRPAIRAQGRLRQKDQEFKDSLGYMRLCSNKI